MNAHTGVWFLLFANGAIAAAFAAGVQRCAGPWSWPPTWLRVVELWLGAKCLFLVSAGFLWSFDLVGFDRETTWRQHAIYLSPLVFYTGAHVVAFLYWASGRAIRDDTDEHEIAPWNGRNRRGMMPGRRATDR